MNTVNYNLEKLPHGYKNYDVPINENFDIIDTEIKNRDNKIGDLANLDTTNKTDLVQAVNELVYSDNTIQSHLAEQTTQLSDLETNKADKTEVNSLATEKADKTYVDTLTQSIASGSPKGTYATLTDLQTAYPTGTTGTYVVTADGKWYYWNGSAWTAGGTYQSTGIAKGSVTVDTLEDAVKNRLYTYRRILPNFYSGAVTTTGADSSNTAYMNTKNRTTILHMPKNSKLKVTGYCSQVYKFTKSGSTLTFNSYTDYQQDIDITFTEESFIRICIYKLDGTNVNTATAVNQGLSTEDIATMDSSVTITSPMIDIDTTDRFYRISYPTTSFKYGKFAGGRIYGGSNALINTVLSDVIYLHKGDVVYNINPNFNLNVYSYVDGILNGNYSYTVNARTEITADGLYCFGVQNTGATVFTNISDIAIVILSKQYINLKRYKTNKMELVYHRGFSSMRAENTLPSYWMAADYGGKYVETDVRQTSDGQLVTMHDDTVDRTTNGTGNVNVLTLTQIKALTVDAPMFVSLYNNTLRVPTFEEFLKACRERGIIPVIELKIDISWDTLLNLIKKYGFEKDCIIISYNLGYLQSVRALDLNIKMALLSDTYSTTVYYNVMSLGENSGLALNVTQVTEAIVSEIHDNGGFMMCFVSDEFDDLQNMANLGVDYFTTNRLMHRNQLNFKTENMYYSASGTTALNYTIPYTDLELFGDVLEISVQVYYEDSANPPVLTVGDKHITATKPKEWNLLEMQFVQKVSGDISVSLTSNDPAFRYILYKAKKHIVSTIG